MAKYLPKSKAQIQETLGEEFKYLISSKEYIGKYIETSDGKYYAGDNIYDLSIELLPSTPKSTNFGGGNMVKVFNIINKPKYDFLSKKEQINASRPKPTEKDYEKYKFDRYFCKRINSEYGYFEIDKETYDLIKNKDVKYDYNLFNIGKIEWALRGNTRIINKNTLIEAEKEYSGLSFIFKNLNQYKSNKPIGIEGANFYDPYKKTGQTSDNLKESIIYTENLEKNVKSPSKLINVSNHTLYNIPNRKYTDNNLIPSNLPPVYGLPKPIEKVLVENQKCASCWFNQSGYCSYWAEEIREKYWCASWVDQNVKELTYAQFTSDIMETMGEQVSEDRYVDRPETGQDTLLAGESPVTPLDSGMGIRGGSSGGGGGGY